LNRVDENMDIDARTFEEAEAWFSRLLADDRGDREDFERWLLAAPAHAIAWGRTQALWERMGSFVQDEALSDCVREALEPEPDVETGRDHLAADDRVVTMPPHRQRPTRRRFGFVHAAAAAIVVVAVAAVAVVCGLQASSPQLYVTGDHGSEVRLADGSQVHMDIHTRMQARLGWWQRSVSLLQGRAVFDVVHDGRPFVVQVGEDHVTVLGTRFQVDRRPDGDDVVVTLMRGSVAVDLAESDAQVQLQPGQQMSWQASTGHWSRRDVDTAVVTSWTRGFLVFNATPLAQAVTEINRYSTRKLRLADPSLGNLQLSGSFRMGDAAATANALPYVLPVTVHGEDKEIIISHR
jgi:transmembrane sensor